MTRPANRAQQQAALSAALSGAVDLGALKARAEAPPAPPGAVPTSSSEYVVDVTEASFEADVVARSMQVPVVLDLWATWCEPCKQLSPILERLAEESAGTWVLAKVDVDANPRLAQGLGVQGIPAIKAIFQGQIVAEFQGAQPEPQVREFLQAVVEATGGQLPEAAAPQEDPRILEAEDAMVAGELDKAESLYAEVLAEIPHHPLAKDALQQIGLLKRLDGSGADPAQVIADANADPADVDKQCAAADIEVASLQFEAAFNRLLQVVRTGDDEAKDTARKRLIELFAVVGDAEPAVGKARRDLASALF